jgi:type 1 glutamine amidotransferase
MKPLIAVLILTGQSDTQYHDWRVTTPFVERVLAATGRFETRVVADPRGITRQMLDTYDTVIVNYNGPRWGDSAEAALSEYVRSGKGLVSFHGVTYGPLAGTVQQPGKGFVRVPGWDDWPKMLGVSWAPQNIGHAARHAFAVKPGDHAITRGMPAEFTVNDELYHRMDLSTGSTVIATAFDDAARGGTGKTEPIAWTNTWGSGRTFHTPLGHDTSALYQPNVMAMLARAVEWTATGAVTLPAENHGAAPPPNAPRVLVITGGHSYTPSFYDVFASYPDIRWTHVATQKEAFTPKMEDKWDVLVFYDLNNSIGEAEQRHLRAYVEAGKGVVALHHSIVDFTSWPWWYQEVIGGKYFEKPEGDHPASKYKDDVPMVVKPARGMERHPIVRGLGELSTIDECYRAMWHSPGIKVLMETQNEFNDRPVVYLGPRPGGKSVYIQLGHGAYTHQHPGYRTLVHNAIMWAAGRMEK